MAAIKLFFRAWCSIDDFESFLRSLGFKKMTWHTKDEAPFIVFILLFLTVKQESERHFRKWSHSRAEFLNPAWTRLLWWGNASVLNQVTTLLLPFISTSSSESFKDFLLCTQKVCFSQLLKRPLELELEYVCLNVYFIKSSPALFQRIWQLPSHSQTTCNHTCHLIQHFFHN